MKTDKKIAPGGKKRILLWIVGNQLPYVSKALDILSHQLQGIEVVGAACTRKPKIVYNSVPVPIVAEHEIPSVNHDVLLVAGGDGIPLVQLIRFIKELKGDASKLLLDRLPCIPGFTLEKYRKLQKSRLSIFSLNCFGGIISHTLGLPFLTPFINMFFESEQEYIRFLRNPRVYREERLELERTELDEPLNITYPVYRLGNVLIHMNHYPDFDKAVQKWRERKEKINWYNLCAIMYTDSPEILQQFDELPYGKKICFVSFPSRLDSAFYIDTSLDENRPLWDVVNRYGFGAHCYYYDPFDLLLYGKKTQLMDM